MSVKGSEEMNNTMNESEKLILYIIGPGRGNPQKTQI